MFDLHAHVLPAIDDGPRSVEEAITAIAALAAEGITDIVATPHYSHRYPKVPASDVQTRVNALQRMVRQAGHAVRLYAGHDVYVEAGFEDALAQGVAATINDGPYVLVDLPAHEFPVSLCETVGRLRTAGFIPIIGHVERYAPVRRDSEALVPLVEAGALLQLTAASLAGAFGETEYATAELLLRRNLAHVFGSDMHALHGHAPRFAAGLRAAEALVGRQRVWDMALEVPRAIVRGLPVTVPPVLAPPPARAPGSPGSWPFHPRSA